MTKLIKFCPFCGSNKIERRLLEYISKRAWWGIRYKSKSYVYYCFDCKGYFQAGRRYLKGARVLKRFPKNE